MSDTTSPLVAVFGSSQAEADSPEYLQAMRCGSLLAAAGFRVATGGYGGTMEAVSRGAAEAGGYVLAVTAPQLFPNRAGANAWASSETPRATLALRIAELLDGSVAAIALPGSIGTFTELMVAWNASFIDHIGDRQTAPVVAVGDRWAHLIDAVAGVVGSAELVTTVGTVDEAVAAVVTALAGR